MSSEKIKEITIYINIIDNSQGYIIKKLNPDDRLSDIRKDLENSNDINDMMLFSKKENDKVGEVKREDEEKFILRETITIENGLNILYLKRLYWEFLSNKHKLDHGRIMSFDGIKIAGKQAYTISDCEIKEIDNYNRGRLEFKSEEDWMKKTNLFLNVNGNNITSFVKLGLSIESVLNKSFNKEITSAYQFIEVSKVSLKFNKANLKLTDEFKNAIIGAIQSKDPEKFKKITEDYGQLIPTEIILGGRVYFNDVKRSLISSADTSNKFSGNIGFGSSDSNVGYNFNNSERTSEFYNFNHIGLLGGKHPDDENFDEKAWNESYQNWGCIEFRNPISIFQLLTDDLPDLQDLRKNAFKSMGKRILYTYTEDCDYPLYEPGRYRTFELKNIPQDTLEMIQNEEADCDIFASVFDNNETSKNVFFDCQILKKPKTKPSIIIRGIQKKFQKCKYNLKIKIMVMGFDINFNFILPDNISVKSIRSEYEQQNISEFYSIPLNEELYSMLTSCTPFFGIPVLSNLDSSNDSIIIGHNFCKAQSDNKFNVDVYSYCIKKKSYEKLPKFTFCTYIISSNNCTSSSNSYESFTFNYKYFRNPSIKLNTNSVNPKCVSLILSKNNNYHPFFSSQKTDQIKIKYLDCNCKKTCSICKNKTIRISKTENNVECILFDIKE
ncbi:hypothetical protein RclHR1_10830003 [Rhizophagus clarus]|uniref:DUF7431 domain-containing protein n=1 Tax=Rhizophagus clarus TaxID=94130 RepID=A0A2Z6Q780_9GLOM|nr:hypothetical protein RclHR1_10830003 [Rhizophagus clarus]GES80280.1 hypothetical protein GLOIN_2v1882323 [Rhizophagus clarus]